MKMQKTWLTVHFYEGNATIELTINYQTKSYTMTHGSNDQNVTFNGHIESIQVNKDRLKCVASALKFIEQELNQPK